LSSLTPYDPYIFYCFVFAIYFFYGSGTAPDCARLLSRFSHCEIAICPKGHAICRRCSNLLRLMACSYIAVYPTHGCFVKQKLMIFDWFVSLFLRLKMIWRLNKKHSHMPARWSLEVGRPQTTHPGLKTKINKKLLFLIFLVAGS